MKTFNEWIEENYPEIIEEINRFKGFGGRIGMGTVALSSLFGGKLQAAEPLQKPPAAMQTANFDQQQRLEAMQKVSRIDTFKKNWNKDFTAVDDQKLFDAILKLKTVKDHDDFIHMAVKSKKEMMRVKMYDYSNDIASGRMTRKEAGEQIHKTYDYQYKNYLINLAVASKSSL